MPNYDHYARMEIVIEDRRARRGLRETGREAQRTGGRVRRTNRRFSAWGRTVATITKALISMAAVLVAFNALVTVPELLIRGLGFALIEAAKSAGEFEEAIIGLQSILATTLVFSTSPLQNFREAGLVAARAIQAIALRADELVGSLDEATKAYQVLISAGITRFTTRFRDLVDLSILLTNTVRALTPGQPFEKQISEEIRSLLTGTIRSSSVLTRLLFQGNTKALREFLAEARRGRNIVELLRARLTGFDAAAESLSRTLNGVVTSFQSLFQIISFLALGEGGILTRLLNRFADMAIEIQQNQEGVNLLAARFGTAVDRIVQTIFDVLGLNDVLRDTDSLLEQIGEGIPVVTEYIIRNIYVMESFVQLIRVLYDLLFGLIQLVVRALEYLRDSGLVELLSRALTGVLVPVASRLRELSGEFATIAGAIRSFIGGAGSLVIPRTVVSVLDQAAEGLSGFSNAISGTATAIGKFGEDTGNLILDLSQGIVTGLNTIVEGMSTYMSRESSESLAQSAMAGFSDSVLENLDRIQRRQAEIASGAEDIPLIPFYDLSELIATNRELLTTADYVRALASATSRFYSQALRGATNLDVLLTEPLSTLRARITDQRNILLDQLRQSRQALANALAVQETPAELNPQLQVDPVEVQALKDQIDELTTSISALGSELISLDRILDQFANTTLVSFTKELTQLLRREVVAGLITEILRLKGELNETTTADPEFLRQLRMSFGITVEQIGKSLPTLKDLITSIKDFILSAENLVKIVVAVGNALAGAITQAIRGSESLGQALKNIFGTLLIALGEAAVSLGFLFLIIGAVTRDLAFAQFGLILIAAGVATIAAGVALTGGANTGNAGAGISTGAEEIPTYSQQQQQIAVQQNFVDATDALRVSSESLQEATQDIRGVSAGEVFMQGEQQAGGITKVLANDVGRSDRFASTRRAAAAFSGI